MNDHPSGASRDVDASEAPVRLERDGFTRTLLRELTGALEDVIGLEAASGFVSVVGLAMGQEIDEAYRAAMGVERLDRPQVEDVLVDLKRRIQGDFYVLSTSPERVVLGNRACPFGDRVLDRPSLCMMTSNVFGRIAADNLGWAKVEIQEAIALGHGGCRVVVHLEPDEIAEAAPGREYFRTAD